MKIRIKLFQTWLACAVTVGFCWPADADAQTFTTIKSFNGGSGGGLPWAGLTLLGNTLFGTTHDGGSSNYGTIFKVNIDGTGHTVLKNFTPSDGENPYAGLTLSGNTLYGTTYNGGSLNYGTVFRVNIDGTSQTVLEHFTPSDGENPYAGLTLSGNTLYGTAHLGGGAGAGTVFKVNTNGTSYTVLKNFTFTGSDGVFPFGSLALSGSTLYGTTGTGGNSNCGTIFRINTDGTGYAVLKSFTGSDGQLPIAGLTLSGSVLFGTTSVGGSSNFGTVFKINIDGTGYSVIKDFNGINGGNPKGGGVILSGSTLYGATYSGGYSNKGVIFKVNTDGTGYGVIKEFAGPDGANPAGNLTLSGNTIYGTTVSGGSSNWGTVFKLDLTPSNPSSDSSFKWARRVASTLNSDTELSVGLATDSDGNAFATAWFDGTNDFGGIFLTNKSGGGQDVFVAKYSSTGALQWARRAGGNTGGWDAGRGVGLDAVGNVYVTGGFFGTSDFGNFTLNAPGNGQFFLAKYDSQGTVQWVRQSLGGNGSDDVYGTGLVVDGAGNSYAVGFAGNGAAVTFGTNNLLNPSSAGYSTFLVKYDDVGAVQWAQLLGGIGQTYATKVALDDNGNVYVRGSFSENITIGTSNLFSSVPGGADMFIAKFDGAGELIWVRQSTGAEVDEGGVAVDHSGNVYVTGWSIGSSLNLGGVALTNAGSGDAFLAKYDNSGAIQWARRAGGTNIDFYWDVALDPMGSPHVVGVLGSDAIAPNGSGGAIATKYDPSGTLQWSRSASGPAASPVSSVAVKCAVDLAGGCYLAGWYRTTTTFGTNVLQPQGYWNFFLAKVNFTPLTLALGWNNSLPQLSVFGEVSNRFTLEYVSALATNNDWQNLMTNTIRSSPLIVTDTNATGVPSRFYRARLVP